MCLVVTMFCLYLMCDNLAMERKASIHRPQYLYLTILWLRNKIFNNAKIIKFECSPFCSVMKNAWLVPLCFKALRLEVQSF